MAKVVTRALGLIYFGRLFTDQQLIDLYEQGLVDREIAEKLRAHPSTVTRHRNRLGLKANGCIRVFTDQQLIDLHEQGLNDREIGEKLGSSRALVSRHRTRLGLKANAPLRKPTTHRQNPKPYHA